MDYLLLLIVGRFAASSFKVRIYSLFCALCSIGKRLWRFPRQEPLRHIWAVPAHKSTPHLLPECWDSTRT